ncbi:uncharacterized protein LOC142350573 isoform X2 [Convolutriloba macropyga]|uniref:uncharacterized protein LOC142350573 isoform X2 n=1 Tax=Convolutriloba macropyga TaxID=536237 RepID=UPI003F51AD1A
MAMQSLLYILAFSFIFVLSTTTYGHSDDWKSQVFILSDKNGNELNRRCAMLSTNFCLYGYLVENNQRQYKWQDRYSTVFEIIISRNYEHFNWFALGNENSYDLSNSIVKCCSFQTQLFIENGRNKGLSPIEYYIRATKTKLNYVSVGLDKCGRSRITAVGFGTGQLKYVAEDVGVNKNSLHTLPILQPNYLGMSDSFYSVHGHNLVFLITYDWFKRHVICREKRWICAEYGPRLQTAF